MFVATHRHFPLRRALVRSVAAVIIASAANPASADVVTRPLNLNLSAANGPFDMTETKVTIVDFDLDGTDDFSFEHSLTPVDDGFKTDSNGKLTLDSATVSQFLQIVKDTDVLATDAVTVNPLGNYVETLLAGSTIGASSTFISLTDGAYDSRLFDSSGSDDGGAFSVATGERLAGSVEELLASSVAYVGFKFGSADAPQYGYLRFTSINNDAGLYATDYNSATLSDVTYETTPGQAITIAAIEGEMPEPATLAAMSIAGAALVRRRRA